MGEHFDNTDPKTRGSDKPRSTWDKPKSPYQQVITGTVDPREAAKSPLIMDFASQKQWEFADSVRQNRSEQVIAEKSAAVREEIMHARWGNDVKESDLSKGEIAELNRATLGMQANLLNAMSSENQGDTARIQNFNKDFGISVVKNSQMY